MAVILPYDPAAGILLPGWPQTRNPRYFAVPQGLVGYWGFDPDCVDLTANTAADLSPSGNTIPLFATPAAAFKNGQVGNALSFNGSVFIDMGAILQTLTNMTIGCWINTTQVPASNAQIVERDDGTGPNRVFQFRMQSTGVILWVVFNAAHSAIIATGSVAVNDGTWHFVEASWDGTTARIYVDGKADGTNTGFTGNLSTDPRNPAIAHAIAGSSAFVGTIDELRFYNRALDPGEHQQLYQAGLMGRRDAMWALPGECEMSIMKTAIASLNTNRLMLMGVGT